MLGILTVCGTDVGDTAWSSLIQGYTGDVNACSRSCLLSSVLMSMLDEMLKTVQCIVSEQWGCASSESFLPSADGYLADDEVSLCKLGGYALFSCIHLRKRKLMWKRKLSVSQKKALTVRAELTLLKQLVDSDKCDLPAAIHDQDRGKMTLMHPSLLPFIRVAVTEVRKLLNYQEYSKHGQKFFKVIYYCLVYYH